MEQRTAVDPIRTPVIAAPDADMALYARVCASVLAKARARSGDAIAIVYLGSSDVFDSATAAFAEAYADHNERDHAALLDAIASGRVQAQTEQ